MSAFCVIDALISSKLVVVSSTDAACSEVPLDNSCDDDDTCNDALASAAAPLRTSPMIWLRRWLISSDAICRRPISSLRVTTTARLRSPLAMRAAACSISRMGRAMPRVTTIASSTDTNAPASTSASIRARAAA